MRTIARKEAVRSKAPQWERPEALAEVQRNWLLKLRTGKGLAQAVNLAGPFIMTSQGKP
jgi:hypothetical protein